MADISTELQAIRQAVYGEEVRGSIINALDKMNNVVREVYVPLFGNAMRDNLSLINADISGTTGALITNRTHRIASKDILSFTKDVTVTVDSSLRVGYLRYNSDGTYIASSWSNWASAYTIPSGTYFRIIFRAYPTEGDSTSVLDIDSNIERITFNIDSELVEDLSDLKDEVSSRGNELDSLKQYVREMSPLNDIQGSICELGNAVPINAESVIVNIKAARNGNPTPDNPQSIHGWTEARIIRSAKNRVIFNDETKTSNGVTFVSEKGVIKVSGTATNTTILQSKPFYVAPGESLIAYGCPSGGGTSNYRIDIRNSSGVLINSINPDNGSGSTFVVPEGITSLVLGIRIASGFNADGLIFKPIVCDSSSADRYSVSFPSDAGTVYGGTLDLNNGKLTVEMASIVLDGSHTMTVTNSGTDNWTYMFSTILSDKRAPDSSSSKNISSHYPRASISSSNTAQGFTAAGNYIRIRWGTEDTVANFKSWLTSNPVTVVYELETPVVYDVDPVSITMLKGSNVILAECGDIKVDYRTDISTSNSFKPSKVISIMHGGTTSYPSNTLETYRRAYKDGMMYWECDVKRTSDGNYVLCHDDEINSHALTATGEVLSETVKISTSTLAQLKEYRFGRITNNNPATIVPGFENETIPTLKEFLLLAKAAGVTPFVEIKFSPTESQMEDICNIIKATGMLDSTYIIAFANAESVVQMACQNGIKRLSIIYTDYDGTTPIYGAASEEIIDTVYGWYSQYADDLDDVIFNPTASKITEEIVEYAGLKGMKCGAWTFPEGVSSDDIRQYFYMGVTAFITNKDNIQTMLANIFDLN